MITMVAVRNTCARRLARATVALVLSGLCAAPVAQAALGQAVSSVWADGRVTEATHVLDLQGPLVSETTVLTSFGVQAREFSGPSGRIFAMTWSTHGMPYIKDLYAGYFPGYLAWIHAHPQPGYVPALSVQTQDLRAHMEGHMGDWFGSAYVPALIPPGVDLAGLGVQP